jgi:glutamate--cysteine ligase
MPHGHLAQTPIPALGSKLTHPWITTDYSEALLEFITPPSNDPATAGTFLRDIHRFTARAWATKPCGPARCPACWATTADIPLADYGSSNRARIKYVYREGLGLRYGRHMQTIAGVHYNWSLPDAFWTPLHDCCESQDSLQDFISTRYFGLIRNFLRYGWLIPYLFGASPAICQSFLQGRKSDLQELVPGTLYGPYATSLRMSDLGYQNSAQANLHVSFNSLPNTPTRSRRRSARPTRITSSSACVMATTGNSSAPICCRSRTSSTPPMRPKRVGHDRPAKALRQLGVEYIEMRLFDLNPMVDIGITPEQGTFADVLLLMCLFRDSPPISAREQGENDENKRRIVTRGRQSDLHLLVHNHEQPFRPLAHELFDDMAPFAEMLDTAYGGTFDTPTPWHLLRQRIDTPDLTPSAQVLEAARAHGGFFKSLLAHPLTRCLRSEDSTTSSFATLLATKGGSWTGPSGFTRSRKCCASARLSALHSCRRHLKSRARP